MSRVSKRLSANREKTGQGTEKRYKAGIYGRLSSDADVNKNESVETQVRITEAYIEEWNSSHNEKIEIAGRYLDLGKTGSNFNRDEFQRLMQDIRLGDINCVVVKDLSRFGRNYLEAGNYIERIFPFLGVRFIAVTDGLDTESGEKGSRQMSTEIKNLINDMYAKDFSAKAKQSLAQRRQAGSYVGGSPPYGYKAVWEEKVRKLVPDEATADIVRLIFEYYIETENFAAVANELSRKRINPPAVYHRTGEAFGGGLSGHYKCWSPGNVRDIIQKETYLGKLVQGKTSITGRNEDNRIHKSKDEWVILEHAHEPLIDADTFNRAAGIYDGKRRTKRNSVSGECPLDEDIFEELLYCGVCGRKMSRTSQIVTHKDGSRGRVKGYYCISSIHAWEEKCPESNRISMMKLTEILTDVIRAEFAVFLKHPSKYLRMAEEYMCKINSEADRKIRDAKQKLLILEREERSGYIKYREGHSGREEYVHLREKWETSRKDILEEHDKYVNWKEGLISNEKKHKAAVRVALDIDKGVKLNRELLVALVNRVNVYPGKRIEVIFNYTDMRLSGAESEESPLGATMVTNEG